MSLESLLKEGKRGVATALVGGLATLAGWGLVAPREAAADVHVPIVGSVSGANNSVFKSDLKLYNPTDAALDVTITLTERSTSESAEDPRLSVTIPPRQTLAWENIYDAITPGSQGAGKLRITSSGVDPVVSTNTYTKREDGGEFGQVPTPFTEFYDAGTTLAGIVQKAGQRHNSFVMAGPDGATITYTARDPANGQAFTATITYAANSVTQHVGGAIAPLANNSSLEAQITAGSARYAGNNVDNTTNQGAWEEYGKISVQDTSAPAYVGKWLPPSDSKFYLSNREIRAMINGGSGTQSYARDIAEILVRDVNNPGTWTVDDAEQWLRGAVDGVWDPNTSNLELYRSWDPFVWDNDAQGAPVVAFAFEPNQGLTPFNLQPQDMQSLRTLIRDQFLVGFVGANPDEYGGVQGGTPNINYNPTWNTNDAN